METEISWALVKFVNQILGAYCCKDPKPIPVYSIRLMCTIKKIEICLVMAVLCVVLAHKMRVNRLLLNQQEIISFRLYFPLKLCTRMLFCNKNG